ncbi:hypothetical protein TVAG_411020 [Trichomonas vaginalis G3]|uniref:Uncharacterized protein n=1 Tax=Trichomonas vaginalis (strain ATCC PRA-98 / G3) TaxID=412133 RepID=A2DXK7_TRIV3|nr:hypothetical protein TVAGG3_0047960 [Trichomonas vaginalis G3]EAY14836.1 hypothetical protein TVAG_411020 [Trichomonas vaginalis G3]KAI5541183.1 hypothetical protein TVAGG3_0047960 [Trichomonas vaginalis G3]|eukprot:XP_001327059.1 hypothetical protein [Trichomonas vaginalis G3]
MPIADLSVYFDVSPPALFLDLSLHSMNDLSPVFDTNFLLIRPNDYDRSILLKIIEKHIKTPFKISQESALFNNYFQNKVTILPINTVISCKKNHPNYMHTQPLKGILNASAILFEHGCEPWIVNNSFSTLWHQFVAYFGQTLDIHPNYQSLFPIDVDYSNVETFFYNSGEKSPTVKKVQKEAHNYEEDNDKDIYVYVNTTIKNILTTIVLIMFTILFSLSFLKIVHIQFYEAITGSLYKAKSYVLLK